MRNAPIVGINALSDASNQNGSPIPASQIYMVSGQAVFSDTTAAGTVKLQASNDAPPAGDLANFAPTNWIDIPNTSQTVTAGAKVLIPATQVCYQWIRAVWTQTTPGVGTVTVTLNAQGF